MLRGWAQVAGSWDAIFRNTAYIQFVLTDEQVVVAGDAAWVTLDENILQSAGAPAPTSCRARRRPRPTCSCATATATVLAHGRRTTGSPVAWRRLAGQRALARRSSASSAGPLSKLEISAYARLACRCGTRRARAAGCRRRSATPRCSGTRTSVVGIGETVVALLHEDHEAVGVVGELGPRAHDPAVGLGVEAVVVVAVDLAQRRRRSPAARA